MGKPGRKPLGDVAMSTAERVRKHREAKASGAVQRELSEVEKLKKQVAELKAALAQQPLRNEHAANAKISRVELTAAQQKKFDAAIKKEFARLDKLYSETAKVQVEAEVERRVASNKANYEERYNKAEEREARYKAAIATIDAYMTEDEYKLILNCLHPDRAPEDRRARFNDAFVIFRRMETYVNRKVPISTLRARGWAR